MCGIAGFVGPGDQSDLAAMTQSLAHRGPDGEGLYVDAALGVHLGHRRLAVIDLPGGAQPMWNETGDVAVIYNGEIYNHLELRQELAAQGHRFASDHSDTEVLVHGYEEWGEELPRRLNGMFAFAILDRRRRRLFMARDRFGEKPLFYARQGGLFLFASELAAFGRHGRFRAAWDRASLRKYFAHGFIPAPNAALAGARKLEPGHWLSFDLDEERLQSGCYWKFELEPADPAGAADEAGLAEELLRLLRQAVRRRMMSDVPLGVFLSGGVDSSAVLALAAEGGAPGSVSTFTIGFGDPSYDESAPARVMAEAAHSAHFERRLELDEARLLSARVLERLDEPIADASIVPAYLLSGFARERVKVALGGDGGDELFAGYDPVAALNLARFYDRVVPRLLRRPLRRLVGMLPIGTANMSLDFKLRRALAGLDWPAEMWNPAWLGPLQPGEIADLFQQPADAEEIYSEAIALWRRDPKLSPLERTLEFQTRYYLADDVLAKVDRASMMHGLEARAPFLDNDLVEFVRRLPTAMKYRKGERKVLLKRALTGLVPDALLKRPKKGFGVPLVQWMREAPPETGALRGVPLDRDWVESQRAAHVNARADQRLFLWSWLAAQKSWINSADIARAPGQRIVEAATPAPRRRRTTTRAFR